MYRIVEITLIIIIVTGSIVLSVINLRKELKGKGSCGDSCDSCKIKNNCPEEELKKQKFDSDKK
ncbi:hypothetical protein LLG07_04920 [bacterium]|nr:hypothetical protein [bacterium]